MYWGTSHFVDRIVSEWKRLRAFSSCSRRVLYASGNFLANALEEVRLKLKDIAAHSTYLRHPGLVLASIGTALKRGQFH